MRHAGLLRKSSHAPKEGVMLFTFLYLSRTNRFRILHGQSMVHVDVKEKLPLCTATTFRSDLSNCSANVRQLRILFTPLKQ